ncbi:hypothetical protein [Priestia flexa]|uniref:hypothetical protein n=1 Tax=Priestia flexa TaxID=86664 RepID=UPI0004734B15|nr:hypothetical protein [Priestia flexa]
MEQALSLFRETGKMHWEIDEGHSLDIEAITESFETSARAFDELMGAITITETLDGDSSTVTIGNEVGKVLFLFLCKRYC